MVDMAEETIIITIIMETMEEIITIMETMEEVITIITMTIIITTIITIMVEGLDVTSGIAGDSQLTEE